MFTGVITTVNGAMEAGSEMPSLIVEEFDGRAQDALDADAVGTHDGRHFLARGIQHAQTHRLGVLVARA
jgi:hypothetical protein